MPLFDEYLHEDNISNALLVGRNMVNKEPQNVALFSKYVDLLFSLADKLPIMEERKDFLNQAILTLASLLTKAARRSATNSSSFCAILICVSAASVM